MFPITLTGIDKLRDSGLFKKKKCPRKRSKSDRMSYSCNFDSEREKVLPKSRSYPGRDSSDDDFTMPRNDHTFVKEVTVDDTKLDANISNR